MSAQASRPGLSASIAMHHGAPAIFIGGQPTAALAYVALDLREDRVRQFAEAGVEIFSFPATSDYDYYGLAAESRPAPDRYDYGPFRERMELLARAAPRAKVLPRVVIGSPPWWDKAHPDQLLCGADGSVYEPDPPLHWPPAFPRRRPGEPGAASEAAFAPKKMTAPSFSSQAWREDSGEALERFLAFAEGEFGDRIIGYHLCSGAWYAWCYWGTMEPVYPDAGPPQQEAFRQWLKRRGWAGVRDQEVPPPRERLRAEFGEFRDPGDRAAALAMEYSRFHSEAVVEAMAAFLDRARGVVGPAKLLGAMYGNFADFQRHPRAWHMSGHLAMRKFLAEADVNFVAGPTSARDRRAVRGTSVFTSLTESVTHRGKLWWDENDLVAPLVLGSADPQALQARSAEELRHMERREFANVLCHGAAMAWIDAPGGGHDAPGAAGDLARMVAISRRALKADRSPAAEVAAALDDESVHALRCDNRLTGPLVAEQLVALGHMGAPFAVVHVDDLPALPQYKLYVFLNCFCVSEDRLKRTCQVARAAGVTALWFYAPGLVGESLSVERMERLTGLRLALDVRAGPLVVRAAAETGKGPGPFFTEYGTQEHIAPVVYADDPDAKVLGHLVDVRKPSTGRPPAVRAGLVRKKVGGASAVFSAAPAMPGGLLRQLAADAGVHIYAAGGEVVYANRSLLALAAEPGSRPHVRLERPGALYDVFARKETLLRVGEGRVPPSPDGTWLFYRGTRKQWEALSGD